MTAPTDTLTDLHWDALERLGRGENPAMAPLLRKKLRRLELITPAEGPRAIRTTPGRRRAPAPRRHVLTPEGARRVVEHRIAKQTRHDVAASVARHTELDAHFDRFAPAIAAINAGMAKTGNGGSP